ncbi:hypothetical protein C8Q70DRAFT_923626 [Cubamyces menziesii]|nr:hypothetical protein C8Q70DRAFT_923626 [Cubamyces menziesii]
MWCTVPPQILQNGTLAALVCAAPPDDPSQCIAICPNPDISGVGVRSAFYLQSVMNTLLVIFSRRDSVPSAWASTLLTASLVIAAMVQKGNQSITLHHATLTMNFATLSCISSLAVAPTLSIWRLTPEGYYVRQLAHHVLNTTAPEEDHQIGDTASITDRDRVRIQRAQGYQRLFLALALLTQVVLQWSWGVVLFVSPVYSQTNCSGDTVLIFFLKRFTAREINHKYMVVWVFWLLFSLGITLAMTILLAVTSPARARVYSRSNSRSSSIVTHSSSDSSRHPIYAQLWETLKDIFPARNDRDRQFIFGFNVLATVLWLIFLIASEMQIQENCIFEGENMISSFGQITALLLAAQPMWSLTIALYRWPAAQRRLARRRRRDQPELAPVLPQTSPRTSADHLSPPSNGPLSASPPPAHTRMSILVNPFLTRGRSRRVTARHVSPEGAVAVPHCDCAHTRPTTPTDPVLDLNHIYIPRSSTEDWNELVSLTHLPRAPVFPTPSRL